MNQTRRLILQLALLVAATSLPCTAVMASSVPSVGSASTGLTEPGSDKGEIQPRTPGTPVASQPAPARADVRKLLRDLAHPLFSTRAAATTALHEVPHEDLPVLIEAYNREQDHEIKLRLRAAIEHVFYRRQLEGKMGFLGVQPRVESVVYDPAVGKTVEVIFMTRVLPGFPAEQAGIKTGDMLLEFDGRPTSEVMAAARAPKPLRKANNGAPKFLLPSPPQIEAFTNEISQREPGSQVRMRLLRCQAADRKLELTIADEPGRTLEGARFLMVTVPQLQTPFNPTAGPPMRYGLCAISVAANSPAAAAGFKEGDVIVGAGPMPINPNLGPEQFLALLQNSEPGGKAELTLTHVEQVHLMVTLGGRPVDRMNPGDMEIAQSRFAEWWRAQTGEVSLRNSPNPGLYSVVPRSGTALPGATVLP